MHHLQHAWSETTEKSHRQQSLIVFDMQGLPLTTPCQTEHEEDEDSNIPLGRLAGLDFKAVPPI